MTGKRISLATALGLTLWLSACAAVADGLEALHADIVSDYPQVSHIDAEALDEMENILLLDIREVDEFAVSRLPGAIRLSPSASEDEILSAIGDVSGQDVVVYCSVGRRSSIFARDHQAVITSAGARSVANLEGGIFRWHGEGRKLVDASGPTKAVHPYDEFWKRYVMRPQDARYDP